MEKKISQDSSALSQSFQSESELYIQIIEEFSKTETRPSSFHKNISSDNHLTDSLEMFQNDEDLSFDDSSIDSLRNSIFKTTNSNHRNSLLPSKLSEQPLLQSFGAKGMVKTLD